MLNISISTLPERGGTSGTRQQVVLVTEGEILSEGEAFISARSAVDASVGESAIGIFCREERIASDRSAPGKRLRSPLSSPIRSIRVDSTILRFQCRSMCRSTEGRHGHARVFFMIRDTRAHA